MPDNVANSPLLEVDDLRTTFTIPTGDVKAVRGVSFTLDRGRTLGIVGESGSGKTVLARSIMRLNLGTNVTTTGTAAFDGNDVLTRSPSEMRQLWGSEMAMVFQDPMTSLNPLVRVQRQVTEHLCRHLNLNRSEARQAAVDLLREVRIPDPDTRLRSFPHELSGGMRQRVCIAVALACEPSLLFADEPTTALDMTVQHQILNLLSREQADREMAMVLVTHDLGVVAGRTDDTMVMYAGTVAEYAPTVSLFADMRHPYSEALMRSIPLTSFPSHTRLAAITGRPPDLIDPPTGCAFSPRCPYVQDHCVNEAPPLVEIDDPAHRLACWTPVGSPEALTAFEKNLAAGLPQAVAVDVSTTWSPTGGVDG
jgi:oligopeptide/dipeptide ABC transporter ATP-binding protein